MLTKLIVKLHDALHAPDDESVRKFENILGKIAALNDPDCIGQLLPFFDDDSEYDEMMFSIIHTIECFDDATYVRAIVDHLDSFFAASPRWATVIHMRILNSPSTMAAYGDYIKLAANDKQRAVRIALHAVRRKNAKFAAQCDVLLAYVE